MFATARTLDDFAAPGGVTAVFNAGSTALGHHWQLFSQNGSELARTARTATHWPGRPCYPYFAG